MFKFKAKRLNNYRETQLSIYIAFNTIYKFSYVSPIWNEAIIVSDCQINKILSDPNS